MNTRKEIGSEFYNCRISETGVFQKCDEWEFFLTGRTALDAIVKDIKSEKTVEKALLPAYCCHSMVDSFTKNGIKVSYYDIDLMNVEKMHNQIMKQEYDIVLILNYFGIAVNNFEKQLDNLLQRIKDKITIVDITHSLFSENLHLNKADYYFGSLRKWTGLYSGGMALKNYGAFNCKKIDPLAKFVHLRKIAMTEKEEYLLKGGDKSVFLERFANAEELIDLEYESFGIDSESLDMFLKLDLAYIKNKRRENFLYLLESKDILVEKGLIPLCSELQEDVPLCFPVIAKNERLRDDIRRHLICNDIFCPVHWPLPSDVPIDFEAHNLSKRELSLICDQRYDIEDMKRIVDVIKEYEP